MKVAAAQQPVHEPALLIDQFAPHSQFHSARHRIIDAAPEEVYAAARGLDLTQVPEPLTDAARWLRFLTAQGHTWTRLAQAPEWTLLAERPGKEIVFGAVGGFLPPTTGWLELEPRDFRDFEEPGYGKLVAGVSFRPYGHRRSLVSHDVRIVLADPRTWARFHRYWPLTAPLVGRYQTATLKDIEAAATTLTPAR
ncbi:hypothetical protein [Amycolatopsis cihanbeyliensis]|uniref:DUF1990 domain-containing protein n=1 Tax=Amycolatopsis cihanbeyliensis TaxID=1128664 RepID=A0A542DE18_AMYCI|nr:hypothetical protein [Amycolatopsis cihanbeyliensis]TQJ01312.1 hypothetical protein FB471_0986 [Amycolatopsis cihanbeyliensis]